MELLAEFHPKVVHFAIALLIVYPLFEVGGLLFKKDFLTKSSYILLFLGVLSCVAAVLTGNQAFAQAEVWFDEGLALDDAVIPFKTMNEHADYANYTLWFYSFLLILRTLYLINVQIKNTWEKFGKKLLYLICVLAVGGTILVTITGDIGGKLVYGSGVGTDLIRPIPEQAED